MSNLNDPAKVFEYRKKGAATKHKNDQIKSIGKLLNNIDGDKLNDAQKREVVEHMKKGMAIRGYLPIVEAPKPEPVKRPPTPPEVVVLPKPGPKPEPKPPTPEPESEPEPPRSATTEPTKKKKPRRIIEETETETEDEVVYIKKRKPKAKPTIIEESDTDPEPVNEKNRFLQIREEYNRQMSLNLAKRLNPSGVSAAALWRGSLL